MKIGQAIVGMVAIVAAMAAVSAGAVWCEKRFPGPDYDERQKIARGNAYRVSFWVGTVYALGGMVYYQFFAQAQSEVIEPSLLLFGGIALTALAFHIYCLLTNAALPLGQRPGGTALVYLLLGGVNLAQTIARYYGGQPLALAGQGSSLLMSLVLSVFFLSLSVLYAIRMVWQEKE